jgi:hypothetical protein
VFIISEPLFSPSRSSCVASLVTAFRVASSWLGFLGGGAGAGLTWRDVRRAPTGSGTGAAEVWARCWTSPAVPPACRQAQAGDVSHTLHEPIYWQNCAACAYNGGQCSFVCVQGCSHTPAPPAVESGHYHLLYSIKPDPPVTHLLTCLFLQ